jgi:RHS repeat-associated protein
VNYYHSDHLGSSNVITDGQGTEVQRVEYMPFGEIYQLTGSDITDYKFTGKELDQSTGLYYYGARYYNPVLSHFTQADPIIQDTFDPQTLNHYAYCRNNPLIYIDPTGLSFDSFGGGWSSWSSGWSDIGSSIQNTWNDFSSSMQSYTGSLGNTLNSWATSAMNTMTAFDQSAFCESQIYGSALGMGMGLSDMWQSQRNNWEWGSSNMGWQYLYGGGEIADPEFRGLWHQEFQTHRLPHTKWFSLLELPWGLPTSYGLSKAGTAIQQASYIKTWSGAEFTSLGKSGFYLSGKSLGWQRFGTTVRVAGHVTGFATAISTGADIGTLVYSYYTAHEKYYGNTR